MTREQMIAMENAAKSGVFAGWCDCPNCRNGRTDGEGAVAPMIDSDKPKFFNASSHEANKSFGTELLD